MNQQLLSQAIALHQQGRLADAEPLYQQVLGDGPNYQAQYLLAMLLYQQQRIEEAAAAADTALWLNPEGVETLLLKGAIAQAAGRGEEAVAALSAATAQQPGNAAAWYNLGVVLAGLARQADAIAAFDRALAIAPNPAAWTNRGAALQALGRHGEALDSFAKALALDPAFVPALFNRGVALLALDRPADAVAAFDAVLAKNPSAHDAWNNRGVALHGLNRQAESLDSYDRALALKPDYAQGWKNRGVALTSLKRFDEAVAAFDKAVAHGLGPEIADAFSGRGDVLRHREKFDDAIASYDRALALAPGNAPAWSNRAACLQMMRRFDEALDSVDRALALDGELLHGLAVKGSLLCELGRIEDGMASYQRRAVLAHAGALKASPDDPEHKQRHDGEQRAWLSAQGVADGFRIAGGERLAGPAINPANAQAIAAQWQQGNPKLVVINNLLTQEALEGLRRFCLGSTIWKKPYRDGYLGAMPDHGFACPLLAQIAQEFRDIFPTIFGRHGLGQWWGFKYDAAMSGIRIHADQAAVNVNFWITPDEANLDPDHGGLVVWDVKPPLDWNSLRANGDEKSAREFLAQTNAKPVTVPYRANRAVIFDSDLFHETDKLQFAPGYQNRRINITMLYGRRGEE